MKFTPFILALFVCATSFAQVDKARIKTQAEEVASALLKNDLETVARYTHPKVIEMLGGKEKLIEVISTGTKQMADQGMSIESVVIGEAADPVQAGSEIHCLIPQILTLKLPNGKLKSSTHLLAVSRDKGQNWVFVDTNSLNQQNIKTVLPEFNDELQLPEKTQPEFISN